MCKFAKLNRTHRKVNPALILLLEPIAEITTKINFELHEYHFRETNRNIVSNFEQSQCQL